MSARHLGG